MWSPAGNAQLDALELPVAYSVRIESLRDLIAYFDKEVAALDGRIHAELKNHCGYRAVQQIEGVGRVIGAIFVAEIGDISRFRSPEQLCSWAGLTPKHRESDDHVVRGRITKQGSPLVRWAAVEAISKYRGGEKLTRRLSPHRGAARQVQSPHRGGPQAVDPGVLRPTRRRDPRPRQGQGRVSGPHRPLRARELPWPPLAGRESV
jgi:transposase